MAVFPTIHQTKLRNSGTKTVQYGLSQLCLFDSPFSTNASWETASPFLLKKKKKSQFRNNCHYIAYFPHCKALKEQEKAICCNLAALSILG